MNQHAIALESSELKEDRPRPRAVTDFLAQSLSEEEAPTVRYVAVSPRPAEEADLKSPEQPVAVQASSIPRLPAVWTDPEPPSDVFLALQRWEGIVTDCMGETFNARLTDLTTEGAEEEEVELLLEDVPGEDRALIEPGAVFYWAIGYRYEASGQSSRVSTLRFRRLPVWSAAELKAADERASQIAEVFGGN